MKIMILQIQKYKFNTENEENKYKKIHHVPALTCIARHQTLERGNEESSLKMMIQQIQVHMQIGTN